MGCGKSSVGRRLSTLLCCSFIDLDDAIAEAAGKTIPEIFATKGEGEFRKIEKDTLHRIVRQSTRSDCNKVSAVLALGGGTIMTPECADLIKEHTRCIYLRASVDTLSERLSCETEGRPMLSSHDLRTRITELMKMRAETYELSAHMILDTDGKTIDEIAHMIISR